MTPLPYMIGFLFCSAIALAGRFMRTHPEAGGRIFFWAPHFATVYFRSTGMFFLAMGLLGMVFYAALTLLLMIHAHF